MKSTESGTGPAVSVIVPVYNGEPFVSRCVDCLKRQTLRDVEAVFVDDFSSDGTAAAIERAIADDARFRLIRQPERTDPLRCRREGVLAATGEYVMFLDVDDEFVPEACEKAVETIRREKTDLVVFGTQVVPADGVSEKEAAGCQRFMDHEPRHGRLRITKGFLPELFKQEAWSPSVWNKIVRADVLRDIYGNFRPSGYLGYGQDFLQTILVFLSIRSLYSDIGLRLHRYHLGTGASLRAEGALTWDRFVRIMSSSNTAKTLTAVLADRRDVPVAIRRKIETRFVANFRNNAVRYLQFLSDDDFQRGIDLAVESWGPSLWNAPSLRDDALLDVLEPVLESSAFRLRSGSVRTAGFFFPWNGPGNGDASAFTEAVGGRLKKIGIKTVFVTNDDFALTGKPHAPVSSPRLNRWPDIVEKHGLDVVFLMVPGNGNAVADALVLRSLGVRTIPVFPKETLLAKRGGLLFLQTLVSAIVSGRAVCLDHESEAETAPWLSFHPTVLASGDDMDAFPWREWLSETPVPGTLTRDDPVRSARWNVLRAAAAYERRKAAPNRKKNARKTGPGSAFVRFILDWSGASRLLQRAKSGAD